MATITITFKSHTNSLFIACCYIHLFFCEEHFSFIFKTLDWLKQTPYMPFYRDGMVPVDEFIEDCRFGAHGFDCSNAIHTIPTFAGLCYQLNTTAFPDITMPGFRFGIHFQITLHEQQYGFQVRSAGVGLQV